MRHCGIQQPRGELPELRRVRRGCHARPWLRPGVQEDQLPGPAAAGHVAEERVDDLPDDAAPVGAEPRVRRHGPGHARRRRPPPPPRGPRERPARRYNLPSIFAPSNSHQVKRLGSSWAYSTGRTKSRARRVVAFIRERPSERQRAEISIAQAHARGHELHLLPPAPAPLRRPAARAGLLPPGPRHERPPHLAPRPLSPILGPDGLSPSRPLSYFQRRSRRRRALRRTSTRAKYAHTLELTSNPSRRGPGESSTFGTRASRR